MPAEFARSLRALESDGPRTVRAYLVLAMALVVGWCAWFSLARVTVYAPAQRARLEVGQSVYRVSAPFQTKVAASHLSLGRRVAAGDVLLELDASSQRLALKGAEAQLSSLEPQVGALQREIGILEQALQRSPIRDEAELREARAKHREALTTAQLAEDELPGVEALALKGSSSPVELKRARAQAGERRAGAEALQHRLEGLTAAQAQARHERAATLERLRRELAKLEAEQTRARSQITSLQHQITRHVLRAPAAGTLGEIADVRIGAVLQPGDVVASLVPEDQLHIVAEYLPSEAVGRITPGKEARLRLDGFAWTQYGSLRARVTSVASEARDGLIRVELRPIAPERFAVPLRHGMSGTLETEVEHVTPATLVLRAAGRFARQQAAVP